MKKLFVLAAIVSFTLVGTGHAVMTEEQKVEAYREYEDAIEAQVLRLMRHHSFIQKEVDKAEQPDYNETAQLRFGYEIVSALLREAIDLVEEIQDSYSFCLGLYKQELLDSDGGESCEHLILEVRQLQSEKERLLEQIEAQDQLLLEFDALQKKIDGAPWWVKRYL